MVNASFIASLEPDDQQKVLEKSGEKIKERYEKDCRKMLEDGALIFKRGKPAERLLAYRQQTLLEDMALVLNPDYWKLRALGQAPQLLAEVLAMQNQVAQQAWQAEAAVAMEAGVMPSSPTPPQAIPYPNLWPDLLPLPPIFGETLSRDFLNLERAEARKM